MKNVAVVLLAFPFNAAAIAQQANGDTLSASIAGMFNAPLEAKEPDDPVEPSTLTASITGLLGAADGASAPVDGSNHTPEASKLSSLQVPEVYAVNVTHHGETNSTSAPVVDEIKSLPMAKLIGADEDEEAKSTNSSSLNAAGAVVPTNSSSASVPTKTETPVNTSVPANTTVSLDARNEIKQLKQEVKEEIKREEAQKQQMRAQLKAELKAELKGEKTTESKGEGASENSETSVNVLKDTVRDVVKDVVKKVLSPNTTNKTGLRGGGLSESDVDKQVLRETVKETVKEVLKETVKNDLQTSKSNNTEHIADRPVVKSSDKVATAQGIENHTVGATNHREAELTSEVASLKAQLARATLQSHTALSENASGTVKTLNTRGGGEVRRSTLVSVKMPEVTKVVRPIAKNQSHAGMPRPIDDGLREEPRKLAETAAEVSISAKRVVEPLRESTTVAMVLQASITDDLDAVSAHDDDQEGDASLPDSAESTDIATDGVQQVQANAGHSSAPVEAHVQEAATKTDDEGTSWFRSIVSWMFGAPSAKPASQVAVLQQVSSGARQALRLNKQDVDKNAADAREDKFRDIIISEPFGSNEAQDEIETQRLRGEDRAERRRAHVVAPASHAVGRRETVHVTKLWSSLEKQDSDISGLLDAVQGDDVRDYGKVAKMQDETMAKLTASISEADNAPRPLHPPSAKPLGGTSLHEPWMKLESQDEAVQISVTRDRNLRKA